MRATIRDVGIFREPSQLLYGSVMTQNEASTSYGEDQYAALDKTMR